MSKGPRVVYPITYHYLTEEKRPNKVETDVRNVVFLIRLYVCRRVVTDEFVSVSCTGSF